ncbi:MAG TPA: sulfatase [Thermoanaerobaculia bacterium]
MGGSVLKGSRHYGSPAALAAVVIGLATGIADAAFMVFVLGGTWKIPYLHPYYWLVVPFLWTTILVGVALVFSLPLLRRILIPALVVSGPGLLLLSRGAAILRDNGVEKTSTVVGLWCLVMAVLVGAATRFFEVRPFAPSRWTVAVAGACLVATAGIFSLASNRTVENRVATASKNGGPNIILVFLDTVRFDDTDLDGDGTATPSIDRFATQSTEFDNAWAPAPWTLPSHSAVFTGVDPWRTKIGVPTLAEHLSRAGYDTAAVFANPLLNPSVDFSRGIQHMTYSISSAPCQSAIGHLLLRMHEYGVLGPRICGWMIANEVTKRAQHYIDNAPRPYFLAVNYFDAHIPYYVPEACSDIKYDPYRRSDLAAAEVIERTRIPLPQDASDRLKNQHRAALQCLDRSLGSLIDSIQQQPDYKNTVVAILADHGEQFGKHFRFGHGNSLYRQVLHVPLLLRFPGRTPSRNNDAVTITDLFGTFLQAAHIDRTPHFDLTLFDPAQRRPALAEYIDGPPGTQSFSAADDRHHLIMKLNQDQEFYDYQIDPLENSPLNDPARRQASDLHDELRKVKSEWDGTRHDIPAFRGLGYLE